HRLRGDGKARGLGRRVPRQRAQRRVGVPSLQGRQEREHRRQSQRLLQLPQAARQAGLRLPLRQDEGCGEIAAAVASHGDARPGVPSENAGAGAFTRGRDRAKATARIPFGREVVTFSCGYWPSGVLPAGALNGGTNMTFLKTREPTEVETSAETEVEGE